MIDLIEYVFFNMCNIIHDKVNNLKKNCKKKSKFLLKNTDCLLKSYIFNIKYTSFKINLQF